MRLLAVAAALLPCAALALPPDARLELHGTGPHFEKIDPAFDGALVDPPALLRVEILPSGELLLEAKGKGIARVFLFSKRLVRVVEVAVDEKLGPAAQPCAPVKDAHSYELCRVRGGAGPLEFELEGMQAEAKVAQEALARAGLPRVQFALSAYGIRLKGAKDEGEKRRAVVAVWSSVLGPFRLDD